MTRVVAVTTDLMDRSKLAGAIDGVEVLRPGADLDGAEVVIIDLTDGAPLEQALASGARVIAYGRHTEVATLEAAASAGAEVMARSVFFRRLADGTLLDRSPG